MPTYTLSDRAAHDEDVDVLVVFAAPGASGGPGSAGASNASTPTLLGNLKDSVAREVTAALEALRSRAAADEVTRLPRVPGVAATLVAVVGVGGEADQAPTPEALRRAAGAAGRTLAGRATAAVLLPDDAPQTAGAVAEGIGYGAYAFTAHRGAPRSAPSGGPRSGPRSGESEATRAEKAPVGSVRLVGAGKGRRAGAVRAALTRAEALVEEVAWARDLVNTGPNALYPEAFAASVADRAPKAVSVEVLDRAALEKEGCGGILGVGQGSVHPPVIVRMSYAPKGATTRLAYVGKGITFDSGGLSLKPPTAMITMKSDMSGAAAVAAAVLAIARLDLAVAVDGWLCLAENMPDGGAQRPGDVVTMADGSTCEIINTDAEGRLVLADGLVLASRTSPDAIVDVATLTGAAVVALGLRTAAVLGNDEELQAEVASAATDAGENVWPMPIPEELTKGLESTVADRKHAAEREGGALFAAAFLREYVGRGAADRALPWVHLDIAGPAFNDKAPHGYTGKGGTGFGVRTLVHLAEFRS